MSGRKRTSPEEMSDDVDVDEVRGIVNEIINFSGTIKDKENEFERRYPQFVKRFPVLFKMACKPDFDMSRLEQIFLMMGMVKSNEMSYDDASKQFGQDMFNTYVKPNLQNKKH
jgi:hypothetical protein